MDKFIDNLIKLKDYVPFFQSLVWIALLIIILFIFRKFFIQILNIFVVRLNSGSTLKVGPIELGEKLSKLDYIPQNEAQKDSPFNDRESHRVSVYKDNRGLFLTHLLQADGTSIHGKNIFIYLIRHNEKGAKDIGFSDIVKAEFFFGHMWGNQVYEEKVKHGIVGVKTSAYSPFLCTCFVTMSDGAIVKLHRYIDFEIEKLVTLAKPIN